MKRVNPGTLQTLADNLGLDEEEAKHWFDIDTIGERYRGDKEKGEQDGYRFTLPTIYSSVTRVIVYDEDIEEVEGE